MQRYDLILLDADRTLFDFDRAQAEALRYAVSETLHAQDVPYTEETLIQYRAISDKLWSLYEKGGITQKELQTKRFDELYSLFNITGDAEASNRRYLDILGEGAYLLDGAEELCKKLSRSCRLCIVTNGVSRSQHRRLEKSEIRPYISDIFVSEDLGCQKPQKQFFDIVFQSLKGFTKGRTIILGDSLASDILGGNNAAIDTCWFNPKGLAASSISFTYEIRELLDFYPIIFPCGTEDAS